MINDRNTAPGQTVFTENALGTEDGYSFELWKDTGNTALTITGRGTFSCEWSSINNALFRKGQKLGCTKTYKEYSDITVSYGVDYRPDGNSYLCVYGWSVDPLIEYYIVESWGSWRPPGSEPIGSFEADGGIYDIFKTTRVEMPSIEGTKTFEQFWSVRREKPAGDGTRLEGVISVTKHFEEWEKHGLVLGRLYEVALNIEGFRSKGSAVVYRNELNI